MQTLSISLYCPKMAINHKSFAVAETDIEPMTATLGNGLIIQNCSIPKTKVNRVGLFDWLVEQCVGITPDNKLSCTIPPQECTLSGIKFVAKAIDALVTYTDNDNKVWTGSVHFPDCEVIWWQNPLIAMPVTATGVLNNVC